MGDERFSWSDLLNDIFREVRLILVGAGVGAITFYLFLLCLSFFVYR